MHGIEHQRAQRLQLLAEVARRTTAILSREELLRSSASIIRDAFDYFMVNIFLVNGEDLVAAACTLPELRKAIGTLHLRIGQEGITGWVAANGMPLNVPDVRLDSRYCYNYEEELPTRAELAVPISLKGVVIGVLDVQSAEPGAYTDLDVFTLEAVADQLAVAITNAHLYEELRRELAMRKRTEELLRTLHGAGFAMLGASSPDAVLESAGESLRAMGLGLSVLLWDEQSGEFAPALESPDRGPGRGTLPCPDVLRRVREGEAAVLAPGSITVGMRSEGRALGVVTVSAAELGPEEVPAILVFASQLAAARRTAELVRDLRASLEELHGTQAQLLQSQKMEAVGRLAGGVAHDFNNQLTAIHGYSDLLLQDCPPGDARRSSVEEIIKASRRAAGLTRQLLAFSRKQVLQPRAVDLAALVRGLRDMLRRIIGEDIVLKTSVGRGTLAVRADPAQLEHVIFNLVLNARDAMPQGGTLTVAADPASRAPEGVDPDLGADAFRVLRVTDTGIGMDDAVKGRLFEPFFTTKEPGKGTGLGLSTVYGIVKQSGGYIECASEPGRGSAFTVYLPATADVPEGFTPAAPAARPVGGSESILVIEDEDQVRELMALVLHAAGYTVSAARTGQQGLDIIDSAPRPPDLVITDIMLPGGMSGLEVAGRLRAASPDARLLFMSGYHERLVKGEVEQIPAGTFLPKPFTPADLLGKVREILGGAT